MGNKYQACPDPSAETTATSDHSYFNQVLPCPTFPAIALQAALHLDISGLVGHDPKLSGMPYRLAN